MPTKKFSTPETELLAMYFKYEQKKWKTPEEVKAFVDNYLDEQLSKAKRGYMQFAVKQMIKQAPKVIKYEELVSA